jgi:hypothetical protein
MKKIKCISLKYLIVCSIFIYGCSDNNPINQSEGPYQFDSARFEYKVTRLQGIWYDTGELWAQDTSQVFIVNPFHEGFVHILEGSPVYYYDPSFIPASVAGLSNNEVYLSGLLVKGNEILPGIKKWNGSYLEDFPIDLNFKKTTFINKSLVRSASDMWLFCNNVIIRKDGSSFLTYDLEDTVSKIYDVCYDKQGIPTFSQLFLHSDVDSLQTIKIYKFYNEWTKVFESREEILKYVYSKFDNNICRRDESNIFLFNGSDFSQFFSTDILHMYRIQGFEYNNLMVNSLNVNGYSIFNWNGKKWSQELFVLGIGTVIYPISENLYYFFYENDSQLYTDVVRAFREK